MQPAMVNLIFGSLHTLVHIIALLTSCISCVMCAVFLTIHNALRSVETYSWTKVLRGTCTRFSLGFVDIIVLQSVEHGKSLQSFLNYILNFINYL